MLLPPILITVRTTATTIYSNFPSTPVAYDTAYLCSYSEKNFNVSNAKKMMNFNFQTDPVDLYKRFYFTSMYLVYLNSSSTFTYSVDYSYFCCDVNFAVEKWRMKKASFESTNANPCYAL